MRNDSLPQSFRHRENEDGSWDSICLRCYLTAAHSYAEKPLNSVEARHHCDETSWLLRESAQESSQPMISRSALTVRLAPHASTCPPSAMPRFSREPEVVRFSWQTHTGRPAGLREQTPSKRSRGF